jgi:hypothetical protein
MTTLVANITTITSFPKITTLAFATMVTSVTNVAYIPLLQTFRIILSLGGVLAS